MAEALTAISLAASAVGTGISAIGTMMAGDAAKDAAQYEAQMAERQSNEARAIGQKKMLEKRKKTELAQSRLRATAAKSTGDTTDFGVMNLAQDIEERGEYAALTDFYSGENRARGFEDKANAARYKGKVAQQGSYLKTAGTLFDGIGSFAGQYKKAYG